MDDVVVGAFIMAIAIVAFCVGLNQGAASVQKKCNAYGKAKIGDVMYECKPT